jgi:hypothetical protein
VPASAFLELEMSSMVQQLSVLRMYVMHAHHDPRSA